MTPRDQKKIAILKKARQICQNPSYPHIKQATILKEARDKFPKVFYEGGYAKGTLSKHLKNPENAFIKAPEELFQVLLQIFQREEIEVPENWNIPDAPVADFYPALCDFINVKHDTELESRHRLPGHYITYLPSISEPGKISKGYLEIQETIDQTLETKEVLPYEKDGGEENRTQTYSGYIVCKREHFLLISTGTDIDFPRISILRASYSENGRIERLVGATQGVNSNDKAVNICSRKTVIKRINDSDIPKKDKDIDLLKLGIFDKDKILELTPSSLDLDERDNIAFF